MEILNQFGVQPILLLGQVVNFLILLFILKKVFFKPVLEHLERRKKLIEEGIENAKKAESIINKAQDKYDKKLAEAKLEFEKIVNDAKKEASGIVHLAQEESRKNVDAMLIEAKQKMAEDKIRLEEEVKKEMVGLVALAVEKVTRGIITSKQSQDYTKTALKDLYKSV